MNIATMLNTGLALLGWLYVMFKTGEWIMSIALKQWAKRRKQSRKQKALSDFYDAYDLSAINPGDAVKLATKGGLTILMFRKEAQ